MPRDLVVKWTADVSSLQAGSKAAEESILKVDQATKEIRTGLGQFQGVLGGLSAGLGGFGSSLAGVSSSLSQMLPGISSLGSAMGGAGTAAGPAGLAIAGVGLAVASAGGFALSGAKQFADMGLQVRDFSAATGMSAEQSSVWIAVGKEMGVNTEVLQRGFFMLEKNVAAHQSKIEADGIATRDASGHHLELGKVIENVGVAFRNTEDPFQRAKILMDTFGRSGAAMAPILLLNSQALKEFAREAELSHQVFTNADIQKAQEFAVSLKTMKMEVSGLAMEIGGSVLPYIADFAKGITTILQEADKLAQALPHAKKETGFLSEVGHYASEGGLLWVIKEVGHNSGSAARELAALADAHKRQAQAALEATQEQDANNAAIMKARDAVMALHAEQDAHVRAMDAVKNATDELSIKQQKLADLMAKAPVDIKAVESAHRAVESAAKAVSDANLKLAETQQTVADIMNHTGEYGRQLTDAQDAVARAAQGVSDANENLAQVTQHVNDVMRDQGDYARQLGDAQRSVEDAGRRAADAQDNLLQVQRRLNDVMRDGGVYARDLDHAQLGLERSKLRQKEAADKIIEAEDRLRKAEAKGDQVAILREQDAVAQAMLDQKDAALSLTDAQERVNGLTNEAIPGTAEYAKIQRQLADAQRSVDDATHGVQDAQSKLNAIRREAIPGTLEYEKLQRSLADAHQKVADAQRSAFDSQDRLAKLVAESTPGTLAYAKVQQTLFDATTQVQLATDAQAIAADNLARAEAGDPRRAEDIAQARLDVSKATDAVRNAQDQVGASAVRLIDANQKVQTSFAQLDENGLGKLGVGLENAKRQFPEAATYIDQVLAGLAQTTAEDGTVIGSNLIVGIQNGMVQAQNLANSTAKDAILGVLDTMRKTGLIQSPSRLTAEKVGLPLAQGIVEGLAGHSGAVRDAASGLVDMVAGVPAPPGARGASGKTLGAVGVVGAGAAGAGASAHLVVNVAGSVVSENDLKRVIDKYLMELSRRNGGLQNAFPAG